VERCRDGCGTTTSTDRMAVFTAYHPSADWGSDVNNVLRKHS